MKAVSLTKSLLSSLPGRLMAMSQRTHGSSCHRRLLPESPSLRVPLGSWGPQSPSDSKRVKATLTVTRQAKLKLLNSWACEEFSRRVLDSERLP